MITTVDTVEIPSFPWAPCCFRRGAALKLFEARYLTWRPAACGRTPLRGVPDREGGEVGAPAVPHGVGSIARITDGTWTSPACSSSPPGAASASASSSRPPDPTACSPRISPCCPSRGAAVPEALADAALLRAICRCGRGGFPAAPSLRRRHLGGLPPGRDPAHPGAGPPAPARAGRPISRLEIIQAYLRQHKLLGRLRGCEKPASPSSRPAPALTGSAVPVGSNHSTADSIKDRPMIERAEVE
jgi:hypothetical protein